MSRPKKVDYKEYFEMQKTGNDKVGVCKSCRDPMKKVVKMKDGNTSGLRKHIRVHHKKLYRELFESYPNAWGNPNQKTIDGFLDGLLREENKPIENFERVVVAWVAYKNLPLDFFEDSLTQGFFRMLSSQTFPRTDAMRNMVLEQFAFMRENMKALLSENDSKFSIAMNTSTARNGCVCYEIIAHYIDAEWKRKYVTLDLVVLKKNAENIAAWLYKTLIELNIAHKLQTITLDNVSADINLVKELEELMAAGGVVFDAENQHFRCLWHIFNLAVKAGLKTFNIDIDEHSYPDMSAEQDVCAIRFGKSDEEIKIESDDEQTLSLIVEKVRRLVKKIKNSETTIDELKSCCNAATVSFVEPTLDVDNSWTSMCKMLNTCFDLKAPLDMLCKGQHQLEKLQMNEKQWDSVQMILKFFNFFNQASNIIVNECENLLPSAVILFNMLLDKIEVSISKLAEKEEKVAADKHILSAFRAARDTLVKHHLKQNWTYCISLILDPRHKTESFDATSWGRDLKESTIEKFKSVYRSKYYDVYHDEVEARRLEKQEMEIDSDPLGLYAYYSTPPQDYSSWDSEIEMYLKAPRQFAQVDVLSWWKMSSRTYPILSKMARDVLAIMPTSIPPVRHFSENAASVKEHPYSLKDEAYRDLFIINRWMHCDSKDDICQVDI